MIRKIFFTVGMTLALLDSGAQMVTSTASTPTQLVNDVLLGGGITASTVTYTGANGSRGSFTGGSSIGFLFDEGIILTSGNVSSIPGWNTSGTTSDVTSTGADADLNALLSGGNSTGDKCVLEFDFVATSDSLNFKYIFASEEYPEFVCSDFNDVFAFFLSGPNPAGGNYVKKNIALIPGTNTFVGINTINGGVAGSSGNAANCDAIDPNWASYSGWYNDNPKNGNVIQIKPDGYTDIFTAAASLVCGETYHIKLAIADVGYMGDSYYDSYVFLEAKSFTSVGITSGAYTTDQSLNLTSDTNITEACNTGVLSFVLSTPSTGTTTINYTIGGTATNGVDYTDAGGNPLSGVITIPNGQDSGGVVILPVADGQGEGDETITITFDIGSSCAGSTTQTLTYLLHDPNTV
ncbi:MAG: choice-of-anchor L domain-containing protein, partial [Bacteroidetes bacterium]|nr:choice-of-anchor L domain-containing protein [Bacteroidota bacterium]